MFVDNVEFTVSSGNGGSGCVSFWTEKFVVNGGPDGGDGGRGGSIYFVVDNNTDTLGAYRGRAHIKAENGRPGEGRKRYGRKGKDTVLAVPPGTQVIDAHTDELLLDLIDVGEPQLLFEGGKGGLGNQHFKTASNQRPTYAQPGLPGITRQVRLELKMIADVGLVGFPNVGKSTLISTLSNARPKVANYEFTTLTPSLGVVPVGEFDAFMMADIPGIIEDASDGKGLGLEFLRHIERTQTLLYLIDVTNYRQMHYQYETLRHEVIRYSEGLSRRPFAIALTKIDALSSMETNVLIGQFMTEIGIVPNQVLGRFGALGDYLSYGVLKESWESYPEGSPAFVLPISSVSRLHTDILRFALFEVIRAQKHKDEA
jgi:GTPase